MSSLTPHARASSAPTASRHEHELLSVIIPALNEAAVIGQLLAQLNDQAGVELEVIVCDAGSTDDTAAICRQAAAQVVQSQPGRGGQMNAGAAAAQGDYLLFLHADSVLDGPSQLAEALIFLQAQPGRTAGHFALAFDTSDPVLKEKLRFFEAKTRLNRAGTFNGDQGLLISRQHFALLGGFSERLAILEDQDFGRRLAYTGSFVTLPGTLRTSARRFEQEGFEARILLNAFIMGMFHLDRPEFFERARDIYRRHDEASPLNPAPWFSLVSEEIFDAGPRVGLSRCYRLGRYTARNLWQAFLLMSLKDGETDQWLRSYDRFVKPLTDNFLGYLVATIGLIGWFFVMKLKFNGSRS